MNNPVIAGLLATSLLCGVVSCQNETSQNDARQVVRVTGIPDENPTELQRRSAPLVAWLSTELGFPVEYVPVTDYGAAVQALSAGQVDFAWLGGLTHVQARNVGDAVPVAMRQIDREFKSVFIAHADSEVEKVADLRGKTMAFGSKSSTSGHLMPRHYLESMFHIDTEKDFSGKPVFSGAHDATAKIVESGKVAGGVLNKQVWDRMIAAGDIDQARVRVIWTTPSYTDYVWTSRRGVDPALREKFKMAFMKLDESNTVHRQVLALQGARKFVAALPEDFDLLESVARSTRLLH